MKKVFRIIGKVVLWSLVSVIGLVVMALIALYIPWVQDFAITKALDSVNKGGDMHIAVKQARLKFPLRLNIDSVSMTSPGMEISAAGASANVSVLPLFVGEARVNTLKLDGAIVNIGTPDSSLYMRANLGEASISDAVIGLISKNIDVNLLQGKRGAVSMILTPDTVAKPTTESAPLPWKLNLHKVHLTSIDYGMQMLPTIDTLDVKLPSAVLTDGRMDFANSTIEVGKLAIDSVDARYIVPSPEYIASHPAPEVAEPTDSVASQPWTIKAQKLRLIGSHAVYATAGAVAAENFDPSYIEASEINIAVDSFYNRATEITVPLKALTARERCGIALRLAGTFAMDSTAMYARDFKLTTPTSTIDLDAMMGLDSVNPPLSARLGAEISMDDLKKLMPAAMAPMMRSLPQYKPLVLAADINGKMEALEVKKVSAEIPGYVALTAQGNIADYSDLNRASGRIQLNGRLANGNFLKAALLDAKTGKSVNVPPLRLTGDVKLRGGVIDGDLRAYTGDGSVALDAVWNNRVDGYDVALALNQFPIQSILPESGAKNIDADVKVNGVGLDPFSPKMHATASLNLHHVEYMGRSYQNVVMQADIADGNGRINATSNNPEANFNLKAAGNLAGESYDWTFDGNFRHLDLRALALTDSVAEGGLDIAGKASFRPAVPKTRRKAGKPMNIGADVSLKNLNFTYGAMKFSTDTIDLLFTADDSLTDATLTNRDLRMEFASGMPLDSVMARFTSAGEIVAKNVAERRLAVDSIQRSLPPFRFDLTAGSDNLLQNVLNDDKISFRSLKVKLNNDSLISGNALVEILKMGETRLDTIGVNLQQRGSYLLYSASVDNKPGTMDEFAHVTARGYINENHLSLLLHQENIKGETGYSIGMSAALSADDNVTVRFVPYHPIIGYKDWEINKDNFVTCNLKTMHVDADLNLHNDRSSLRLFTEHHENDSTQEDVVLQLKDILLQDWLAINPFMPPMTGELSADIKVNYNKPDLNGAGTVSLTNFMYGKEKVGDFDLDVNLTTNAAGTVRATTTLKVDGVEAITASGNLNDSTAINPFMLDFRMIKFPLKVVNPFLPPGTASLYGVLNGEMDITGSLTEPKFNGYLDFDSTGVDVTMLGTKFTFSDDSIPVKDNVVTFKDFTIKGVNDNPLRINGNVDITELSNPHIKLDMKAANMQVVGSQKSRKSQVYGKAFVDINADVNGSMEFLNVNAYLKLLPGTNVTYVMTEDVSQLQSRSNQDMVKFVNFRDTTSVIEADTIARPSMLMNLTAQLEISTGTTVNVDIASSGKASIQASGSLNYTMDYMNDQRTTGRINLNDGYVKYSVPVLGEKMFTFKEGSYVVFNGDMLNPQLNVMAVDQIKANVSQSGNNRVVNFDVELTVTGTLDQMNVVFDLECPDDLTITNELKSMSPEQRANQAMNLLLYNTYKSEGTQTISGGNMGTSALFSFVESQLNNWASQAIKGVDLSFGIDQYDKTIDGSNTTATSYSYQMSKSLFDDRFKIVVGGNYTTDANADENIAQNLIADISFEYLLNRAGTMYVRLFRHTGYESILEGEITQTGVGFTYKKKIGRIADIFKFLRPRRKKAVTVIKESAKETDEVQTTTKGEK